MRACVRDKTSVHVISSLIERPARAHAFLQTLECERWKVHRCVFSIIICDYDSRHV